MVYDYLVIGSGFGGSVAAMRLAEKGYSVLVVEQGKRFSSSDFPHSNWNLWKYLWFPALGMYGIQKLSFFRKVSVLSGTGVGGGSLVYGNTLFYPPKDFFQHPHWKRFGDWEKILKPFYDDASFMLGRCMNTTLDVEDQLLRDTASSMGQAHTFKPVYVGVYINDEDETSRDPYFAGLGPERNPCIKCGGCMVGCRENAKNTLDKNYLFFAERFGATLLSEHRVTKVAYTEKGYRVTMHKVTGWYPGQKTLTAKNIVFAAGTLGTLRLLLRQKYKYKTLPALSGRLGKNLLTNSETLNALTVPGNKLNHGLAISSGFYADGATQIEVVKYPDRSNLMRVFFSFAVSGEKGVGRRKREWFRMMFCHPLKFIRFFFRKEWSTNTIILLVMQSAENAMSMIWKKSWFGGKMKIINEGDHYVPAYIPRGQEALNLLAQKTAGIPQNILLETLLNRPTTAHILGGCPMGENREQGVVDPSFRVFGYPGMYITDGSVIQGNIGVNPSFTIMAQAEYAMSLIPDKEDNKNITLKQLIKNKAYDKG